MAARESKFRGVDDCRDSSDLFACISMPGDVVIDNPVMRVEAVAIEEAGRILQRALVADLIPTHDVMRVLALSSQQRDLEIIDLREDLDREVMLGEMLLYAEGEGVLSTDSVSDILAMEDCDERSLLILRTFIRSLCTGDFEGEFGYHLYARHRLLEGCRLGLIDESFLHQIMKMEPDQRDLMVLGVEWELRHVEQLLSVLDGAVRVGLITEGQKAGIMDMPNVYERDLLIYKLENLLAVVAKFRAIKTETMAIADGVHGKAGGAGGLGVLN